MEQILTAPAESEAFVETVITSQPLKRILWDISLVQSPNGDHPHASSTDCRREMDEGDSWESEGWRYIEQTTEEGQITRHRVPLTAYELLHPQEGYVIVNATPHGQNTTYIDTTVGTHLTHDPKAFVFNDVRTDFNLPGVTPVSPDISVVFDVSEEKDWSTFECQEEGVCPSVIFEVTSPGTRDSDFGEKYDYYRQAGVSYYVILDIIYDKNKQVSGYSLFVFELDGNQYVEMQPDYQGRYWLPPLGIWVGVGERGILCYDALGNLLMSHEELSHALDESERERNAAQELADEQKRIAQQEIARAAEQERIAQQERTLAQQEAARADEQEHIAREALQAQMVAEAKIAELLARMAELEDKS